MYFSSGHPPGVSKGFITGEALKLLGTNSSKKTFEDNIEALRSCLHDRGYPHVLVNEVLSEVKFEERKSAVQQRDRAHDRILIFVTHCTTHLMNKWHLIQKVRCIKNLPSSRTNSGTFRPVTTF